MAPFHHPHTAIHCGDHLLAVMVRDDSHNEDGGANDAQKEGRGLISAGFTDPAGAALAVPVAWRIQGAQGGETLTDPAHGPLNTGGLYGERAGWYLPGYRDNHWAAPPTTPGPPGTAPQPAPGSFFALLIPREKLSARRPPISLNGVRHAISAGLPERDSHRRFESPVAGGVRAVATDVGPESQGGPDTRARAVGFSA